MNEPITKLPLSCQIDNATMSLAGIITWTAVIQWTFNTWRAQYRTWRKKGSKGAFIPASPQTMKVFNYLTGESCAMIRRRLVEYGISVQLLSLAFDVWPDGGGIGLHCSFLVPGPQAWMADVILRQYANVYDVVSAPVYERGKQDSATYAAGHQPWRAWGVPAKSRSWDSAMTDALWGWIMGKSTMVKARTKGSRTKQRNQSMSDLKGKQK